MIDGEEKIKVLEEVVRRLEEIKAETRPTGDVDFEDARIDGHVTTALSAARAALSATIKREDSGDLR
ncbi:hypothetical protein BH24ACT19_BH24ACT19_00550 [soil metagenome]|jgi:hypothetical protein